MNEREPTWFGINLNQKQTVYLFFFALIGLLIGIFVFITFFSSIFTSFYWMFNEPYYDPDYQEYYLISMLTSMIPTLAFFGVLISICAYTMSRCRKTSIYFRELNPSPSSSLEKFQTKGTEVRYNSNKQMFCAECGAPRGESQQFCVNCGSKLN